MRWGLAKRVAFSMLSKPALICFLIKIIRERGVKCQFIHAAEEICAELGERSLWQDSIKPNEASSVPARLLGSLLCEASTTA